MNLKEITLEEMELHSTLYEEGLSCLLHTILFVRAPGPVRPQDAHCRKLCPLTYAKCGVEDVDNTVADTISNLKTSLIHVGPHLSRGVVTLSFYEKRENKGFFGILSSEEKVHFERWRIPVLVNESPFPRGMDPASEMTRKRLYDSAREQVKERMLVIFEAVNTSIDHVPPSMYEFALEASGLTGERREHSMVTRLINSPTLMNPL
eukprot:CAMPEP_0185042188 /NCGR_PEP_ID=MMETSP1103-20130426/42203_1 /TAXON_ID=36769 /ORGANISM="Paraphysomonas bandaiensis, Strain Caron Lab Isolate" /LENGTH=205 /DNA_ID=CAMNT_0027582213 /DNA_START=693 /DNA_END=1310 /DNA_ORIENTATION=-